MRRAAVLAILAAAGCVSPPEPSPLDTRIPPILERDQIPGAVVVFGDSHRIFYRKAFGTAQPDTVFDLASCTKVVATTSAAMKLIEEGRLSLDDPLAKYVPAFEGRDIRIRDLLLHRSRLPAYLKPKGATPDDILKEFAACKQEKTEYTYSCLNMISLGRVIETVTGMTLAEYAKKTVFGPLGMKDTTYAPEAARCAPTTPEIRGVVHDPLARAYMTSDHQTGNAGLFSTGDDLALFCQALLQGTLLKAETVRQMFTPVPGMSNDRRGLGWDVFESRPWAPGVGHTGFTGTLIWMNPEKDRFLVLLSNRTFNGEKTDVRPLREEVLGFVNR